MVQLYPSFLEEKAMNTPDSQQAIRIRWYRLWLDRKIGWYTVIYMMKMIVEQVYLCCPGLEIQYTRRSKVGFLFSMRNKLGQVKTFSNERKKGLSFRDFFTRNLDNVTRKACVYYRPPTGNDNIYKMDCKTNAY